MEEKVWFAAKLRFLVLIETTGSEHADDCIYLFRTESFESAFKRALELGRAAETDYIGGTGERVRWRLKEILTLEPLEAADLDGVEVYSQATHLSDDERFTFDHVFAPEASKPFRIGVD